jgi:shikimate dehydrogenase
VPWDEVPAALERVDLLVNATTLGLHGEELPFGLPKRDLAVLDCVYGETPLVRKAAAMGLRVVRGESMLLHQGARSFRLWTGREPPLSAMRLALEASA